LLTFFNLCNPIGTVGPRPPQLFWVLCSARFLIFLIPFKRRANRSVPFLFPMVFCYAPNSPEKFFLRLTASMTFPCFVPPPCPGNLGLVCKPRSPVSWFLGTVAPLFFVQNSPYFFVLHGEAFFFFLLILYLSLGPAVISQGHHLSDPHSPPLRIYVFPGPFSLRIVFASTRKEISP